MCISLYYGPPSRDQMHYVQYMQYGHSITISEILSFHGIAGGRRTCLQTLVMTSSVPRRLALAIGRNANRQIFIDSRGRKLSQTHRIVHLNSHSAVSWDLLGSRRNENETIATTDCENWKPFLLPQIARLRYYLNDIFNRVLAKAGGSIQHFLRDRRSWRGILTSPDRICFCACATQLWPPPGKRTRCSHGQNICGLLLSAGGGWKFCTYSVPPCPPPVQWRWHSKSYITCRALFQTGRRSRPCSCST